MEELALASIQGRPPLVLFLGAHCDDIEIGCGGTILRLREARPDADLRWVILSSDQERRREARASAARFLGDEAAGRIVVQSFRDGFLPYSGDEVKENDPLDLNPSCTYDINHRASVRLAELAKRAGVSRYLYASSCSVYGAASPDDVLDETAAFGPITAYAESKVLVERGVAKLADDSFSPTYLRIAHIRRLLDEGRLDSELRWRVAAGLPRRTSA